MNKEIPSSFNLALIDFDPLVYACGFSIQKTNKETGEVICEPVKHAFYNINHQVRRILKQVNAQNYQGFLTSADKSNFRFGVYKYYKESRMKCVEKCVHPYDCSHEKIVNKPIYYKEVREFIQRRWNAEVISGMEADDACSIAQYENNSYGFDPEINNSIICSIDKDFNNVPGWHYNTKRDEIYYLTEIEAKRNFYLQILTGDTSDGVPRVKKGWRQKKVEEQLKEALTEKEMFDIIKTEAHEILGLEEQTMYWLARNGRLVHLLRSKEDMWELPRFD